MSKVLPSLIAFFFLLTPFTVAGPIFYKTYDEIKELGCNDAKFSLGEGWYCKDASFPGNQSSTSSNSTSWSSTTTTNIWSDSPTTNTSTTTDVWANSSTPTPSTTTDLWTETPTDVWTEAVMTEQWGDSEQALEFSIDPYIEKGVIYAPVQDIALYLGLVVMPLEEQNGIAVIKGDQEILYFFYDLNNYVHYSIATEKMVTYQLPKAIELKNDLTIVPLDIIVQFSGGSMTYNAKSKNVSINNFYTIDVTAPTSADYTQQWTESGYTMQWTEPGYTEQWTEPQYTEQWADTPTIQPGSTTSPTTSNWSENFEIPAQQGGWDIPESSNWGVITVEFINENGRLLVPLRDLFELLGATVVWDATTKTVISKKGDTVVKLIIGSKTAYINGQSKTLDVPGRIVNSKTLIPLRFVAEAFGEKVEYHADKLMVTIGTGYTVFLNDPNKKPVSSSATNESEPSNNSNGGGADWWETQKILDRFGNGSFNMTGTYRPSYQWNSGY